MSLELRSGVKQSVKHLYLAAKAFVQAEPGMNPMSPAAASSEERESGIPQAGVVEKNLQSYEAKDWRTYFAS